MISVRIIVADIPAAVAFYTGPLGFDLDVQTPVFAAVQKGELKLLLSDPHSAGGKPLPDGTHQAPGGWNRVMITVADIAAEVARLKGLGVTFRNDPVTGPAGALAILDDPSGNPIELWQPAAH